MSRNGRPLRLTSMTNNNTAKPRDVSTFLWFDNNAAEAVAHYASIFPDLKTTMSLPQSTSFELAGQRYIAFNGGPHHKLSPAVSIFIQLDSQDEVDHLWNAFLSGGGTASRCGWLTDRYGMSWQIIPKQLLSYLSDPDRTKADRAMKSMLTMAKIDIAEIARAHAG